MFLERAEKYNGSFKLYRPFPEAKVREPWEAIPEAMKEEIMRKGEECLGFEFPMIPASAYLEWTESGSRKTYTTLYNRRRRVLNLLVLAECVEHQGRFLKDIVNGLMAICEESAWNYNAHAWVDQTVHHNWSVTQYHRLPDLQNPIIDHATADTACIMAFAMYLLKDELDGISPILTKRIDHELRQRILIPYTTQHIFWMGRKGGFSNNWTPWCTMNMIMSLYALEHVDEETKRKILLQAASSLDIFLDTYGDDGCCNEGTEYYRVAGVTVIQATDALNYITDGYFSSIFEEPKIKNMAPYSLNTFIDGEYYFNYADCAAKPGPADSREFLFGKRVGNEEVMRFAAREHRKYKEHLPSDRRLNFYYYLQVAFTESEMLAYDISEPVGQPDVYYEDYQLMIARDSRYALAVKGGNNDESHNHNDCGSFTLYKDGKPMFIDLGPESYKKDTFSENRYRIWVNQSGYHNLMTFGSAMQEMGPDHRAKDVVCSLKEGEAEMSMELAGCYPEGTVGSYRRHVVFRENAELRITDTCSRIPEGAFLGLMSLGRPAYEGGVLTVEGVGEVRIEGDCAVETESIPVTDYQLHDVWGDTVYRTRLYPKDNEITLVFAG